jgi:hypothetical protein
MFFVVCPRCHLRQKPAAHCPRCGESTATAPVFAGDPPKPPAPEPPPQPRRRTGLAAAVLGAALLLVLLWLARAGRSSAPVRPAATPAPTAGALDLSGRWHGKVSKTIGANPARPVLKEISIETGRDGTILAASVLFTDPGRGGAGAGYLSSSNGAARLAPAASGIAAEPKGAALSLDFLRMPGWVPDRARLWRALEGPGRGAAPPHYLLLESLETDYLIQAGINESGFLSYVFFSPDYAPSRGQDVLSRVIHPEPGASLRGFHNLIWDLSGAANFLTLQLPVTISGPEAREPDALTLTR